MTSRHLGDVCDHTWHNSYLPAGRTEAVLVCADAVPAEAADLVATGAGEEVDVVYLQRLHTQGTLHGVILHLRAVGHSMARRRWVLVMLNRSTGLR